MSDPSIIGPEDPVLITGATGFIGRRVVAGLARHGYRQLRLFTRPASEAGADAQLRELTAAGAQPQVVLGNLLSREDCLRATQDVRVVFHLAAGRGEKSFPDAFMNSVVTTRNLLEGCVKHRGLKRFVNISSFSVYSNRAKPTGRLLDESCPIEPRPERRGDAYSFAKVKQDEIVMEYARQHGLPVVVVRPGVVYGPGNKSFTGRVGIGTFGLFLHLGGSNPIPLTYVDNCAEAIVLSGTRPGVDGEVFNVVDDELLTSRQFLRAYKRHVKSFRSLLVPRSLSYLLCYCWEWYSDWSHGQLPPTFNRLAWHAYWKKTRYSNAKLKSRLGWQQQVPTSEGLQRYFESLRNGQRQA
jgi:nucleoside-diphosphate-sugar epimerase